MRFSSSFFFRFSSAAESFPPFDAAEAAPLDAALAPAEVERPRGGGDSEPEMEPGESEPRSLLLLALACCCACACVAAASASIPPMLVIAPCKGPEKVALLA